MVHGIIIIQAKSSFSYSAVNSTSILCAILVHHQKQNSKLMKHWALSGLHIFANPFGACDRCWSSSRSKGHSYSYEDWTWGEGWWVECRISLTPHGRHTTHHTPISLYVMATARTRADALFRSVVNMLRAAAAWRAWTQRHDVLTITASASERATAVSMILMRSAPATTSHHSLCVLLPHRRSAGARRRRHRSRSHTRGGGTDTRRYLPPTSSHCHPGTRIMVPTTSQ